MDPRRVLIFREVARSGSISAAARSLGWTQPAVSQHLRALERQAGCSLLLRTPSGVELTEPGRVLLRRADAVAAEMHLAEEELAAATGMRVGRVRLAAYPSASATLVPRAVAGLHRRHPGLEVSLTEAEPPEALSLLEAGEVDVAVTFSYADEPAGSGLTRHRLGEEPVDLVLPPGHRLARRRAVGPADLVDEPWVVGCERCRAHAVEVCATSGFAPDVRHVTDDYVVVQNLVAVGLGVSLLPRTALEAFRHPEVVVRPGRAFGARTSGVVHRADAERVPAIAALLAEIVAARAGWFSEPAPTRRGAGRR